MKEATRRRVRGVLTRVSHLRDRARSRTVTTGPQGAPATRASVKQLRRELSARLDTLEAEIQECRRLNVRLAELTDVVQELLLPVAQRDEDTLRKRLDEYSTSL